MTTVTSSYVPVWRFADNNNNPLVGGKVYTYYAGTTTPAATYTDATGSTPLTNPIILNARGETANASGASCSVWFSTTIAYKIVVQDSSGNLIWTVDNYTIPSQAYSAAYADTFTATAGQTVFTLTGTVGSQSALDVSLDGATLVNGVDFTWTSPSTLTLTVGAKVGQILLVKYLIAQAMGTMVAGGTSGQILYNNGGSVQGFTMSGDVTVVPTTGVATVNAPSSHITYTQGGTGATSRTVTSKLQESVSVLDFGATGNGTTDDSAAIQAAITASSNVVIPPGTYLVNSTINLSSGKTITFLGGASIRAGVNNLTVFLAASSAYNTQIFNASVNGNSKTGVVAFDMTNFRQQAGIYNPLVVACNNGFIFRTGCYATLLLNASTTQTPYPVQLITNDGSVDIINGVFDNETGTGGSGTGIGVDIQSSGSVTIGARVSGGYIQGFQYGVKDAAYGTKIEDIYFEVNTSADIYAVGAKSSIYSNTTHYGTSATAYGFTLSSCDGVTIFNPTMGSGNRIALYNVDNTNTNCVEYHTASASGVNAPIGSLTYLSSIPRQITTTFTPVVAGSTTAGTGTYTVQSGTVVQTGNTIHVQMEITWTAHTGTGNTVVTGIPTTFVPASYTPRRVGTVFTVFAYTGPQVYAYFNGTSTNMTLVQVATTGAQSLIALPASGTLYINFVYDL